LEGEGVLHAALIYIFRNIKVSKNKGGISRIGKRY